MAVNPDPALGGYALVATGGDDRAVPGGIGPSTVPGDTGTKIYIRVPDLHQALDRAAQRFAVFADPDGNRLGLWASQCPIRSTGPCEQWPSLVAARPSAWSQDMNWLRARSPPHSMSPAPPSAST